MKPEDIDIDIKVRFRKEFHEKHNLTEEEIKDCMEIIKQLIYEFFEVYINQIRNETENKINDDSKRMYA